MRFNIIYIISALLLVLSACNKTDIEQPEYGYMYACLEHDTGLEDVNPGTKAVIDAPEDMTFAIDIFDDNDEVVGHFDDHRELLANPIPLKTGTYRAVASCGTDGGAAFDAPVYSGSTEFTVRPETVEAVNIVCSLANVKVTANFDDAIKNNFSSYVLTVSNGLENGTLVYDMNAEGEVLLTGKDILPLQALWTGLSALRIRKARLSNSRMYVRMSSRVSIISSRFLCRLRMKQTWEEDILLLCWMTA